MLGVAIRVAQRMGINNESATAKCTLAEAEMRRRLWWSLVLFDSRIGELSGSRALTLDPTWDCKIPLNVNDSDLRPEMRLPPASQGRPTEAIFAVVRCELGDFLRHTLFHLELNNPALKALSKDSPNSLTRGGSEVLKLEERIENQYLRYCDPENPVHYMTIWTTRAHLAKYRLLEHHTKCFSTTTLDTESQRDAATGHAFRLLECDTKIRTSSLTKGFLWLNNLYFPFPAYIQLVQDLRLRPVSQHTRQAWELMSENYEAWFNSQLGEQNPVFSFFSKLVLEAWHACEAASNELGEVLTLPSMVLSIRHTVAQTERPIPLTTGQPTTGMDVGVSEFATSMPLGPTDQIMSYGLGMQDEYGTMGPETYAGIQGQVPLDAQVNHLNWLAYSGWPGWGGPGGY